MDEKIIIVDNPTNLPLASLDEFILFQGDLKMPITEPAMEALKKSILSHRIFIGKAVTKFNGQLLTEDGHQTLRCLRSLRDDDGYSSCKVITYQEEDGNMVEDGYVEYDDIMIPYQLVVPQGRDDVERKKDAAAKIAIINSQYADLNPETTFFTSLQFQSEDIQKLQQQIYFPHQFFAGFAQFSSPIPIDINDFFIEDTTQREEENKEREGELTTIICPNCGEKIELP